ncbi:MAG: hypothetical protein ACI9F2_000038 [Lysobacterales bacterium]|jgi:hypothetical protein
MRVSVLFLILFISISSSGCVLVAYTALTGKPPPKMFGPLRYEVEHNVADIHEASLVTIRNLDLIIRDDDISRHDAVVKYEYNNGKSGRITIKAITERSSRVSIFIGELGNQEESEAIKRALSYNIQ